jgi:hypothetical protein
MDNPDYANKRLSTREKQLVDLLAKSVLADTVTPDLDSSPPRVRFANHRRLCSLPSIASPNAHYRRHRAHCLVSRWCVQRRRWRCRKASIRKRRAARRSLHSPRSAIGSLKRKKRFAYRCAIISHRIITTTNHNRRQLQQRNSPMSDARRRRRRPTQPHIHRSTSFPKTARVVVTNRALTVFFYDDDDVVV